MKNVMNRCVWVLALLFAMSSVSAFAESAPDVIYWDTEAGKVLRARIPADADFWQLSPTFAMQQTQSYCSVASAITVLNAMPIKKPVDPAYAPYAFFTQSNFFTPEVTKVISAQTVLKMGMTREEMVKTLTLQGVKAESIAGDTLNDDSLRALLQKALGNDGKFVLVNYLRAVLGQVGGGHWSVLAAYDAASDHVLILDVAKYKYSPVWVGISTLQKAIDTIDSTSNKARGLVLVSE
ncbi:MAG: phytochelatin synthase family protein [Gallionellaceae bacterium]